MVLNRMLTKAEKWNLGWMILAGLAMLTYIVLVNIK